MRAGFILLAFCIAVGGGCKLVSTPQWNATQARSRALAEQNQAQLAEIENLRAHARDLENQLLREERLADRPSKRGHKPGDNY